VIPAPLLRYLIRTDRSLEHVPANAPLPPGIPRSRNPAGSHQTRRHWRLWNGGRPRADGLIIFPSERVLLQRLHCEIWHAIETDYLAEAILDHAHATGNFSYINFLISPSFGRSQAEHATMNPGIECQRRATIAWRTHRRRLTPIRMARAAEVLSEAMPFSLASLVSSRLSHRRAVELARCLASVIEGSSEGRQSASECPNACVPERTSRRTRL
jgi:hypothetical protein